MTIAHSLALINKSIDSWLTDIQHFPLEQLCAIPAPGSWSLGQVCYHLVKNTSYYLEQVISCAAHAANATGEMNAAGKAMFATGSFPDEKIDGPDTNAPIPQPASKQELTDALIQLGKDSHAAASVATASATRGKTRHPGLGYFSAEEWLQFAVMHFRHHERQQKRVQSWLGTAGC